MLPQPGRPTSCPPREGMSVIAHRCADELALAGNYPGRPSAHARILLIGPGEYRPLKSLFLRGIPTFDLAPTVVYRPLASRMLQNTDLPPKEYRLSTVRSTPPTVAGTEEALP